MHNFDKRVLSNNLDKREVFQQEYSQPTILSSPHFQPTWWVVKMYVCMYVCAYCLFLTLTTLHIPQVTTGCGMRVQPLFGSETTSGHLVATLAGKGIVFLGFFPFLYTQCPIFCSDGIRTHVLVPKVRTLYYYSILSPWMLNRHVSSPLVRVTAS